MKLTVRLACPADIEELMRVFEAARRFMQRTGNTRQWINGYPQRELIEREIDSGHCYVVEAAQGVVGTFCFIPSPDPTYTYIEEGSWPDEAPYCVIHRLASDGRCRGIGQCCIDWCAERASHLRADTHADNKGMQQLLLRNGFVRCGIIYVSNGTPRIAYQRS